MCRRSCDVSGVLCVRGRVIGVLWPADYLYSTLVWVCVDVVVLVNHSAILYSTQQPWFFISEAQGVSDKPDSYN